ncbi:GNAT family N-acetyltransferase [Mucilaginibacter lacusdianchii]|uniref:GNAT family N-acetyltransferase n=1 Tax=Mucilaginibacter lacusdianchii TaxID=2684211 RepID=UPI00131A9542|nr:GNAT family N-acetyltransferase [Mucilaginibacter sp. JXJ CY 39]
MTVKKITINEAHLVFGLFDAYRVFYRQPSDLKLAKRFITERLQNNESVIYVVLNETGTPLGFTQLYPKYSSARAVKNWILNDLYVQPEHRKKGIGALLIDTAMQFAKTEGAQFVQLETAVDNYTAQSLYEALGFIKQQPDTDFFVYKKPVM